MKKLLMLIMLAAVCNPATACDYEYDGDNGSTICASSGDKDVVITTENGDEHEGEWIGNGEVQDNETGETITTE